MSQPFLSQDKLINQPVGPLQDSASRRIYCYWIHCQFEGQLGDKMGPSTPLLRASRDHFEPLQCMRLGQVTHRHTAASTCGQSRAHTEPLCPSPPCLRPHPPASALPLRPPTAAAASLLALQGQRVSRPLRMLLEEAPSRASSRVSCTPLPKHVIDVSNHTYPVFKNTAKTLN